MGDTPARVLLVEDDSAGRELACFNLRKAGYLVDPAENGESALEIFDAARHALVVTDLRMPHMDGLTLLERIHERSRETPVLVITAYGDVEVAVRAMKAGAFDFIGKPFNRDHLLLTVRRAVESSSLRSELATLRRQLKGVERVIVGGSAAIERVRTMADRVAASDASVIVTGETGTGKELVARRIHGRSGRSESPFIAVNCAALPASLLEAELFGHEKGAFTGATKARAGRFRHANAGTIFLDEVGEMPLEVQGKLLRVLQERVVDVVGRDTPEPVDVRVLAATNMGLAELARRGQFRQDLMYRLNVIEIVVPPLRTRREDIMPLAHHFVSLFSRNAPIGFSPAVQQELESRDWPGNVRQLQNVCERLVLLAQGDEFQLEDLPPRDLLLSGEAEGRSIDAWPDLPAEGLSLMDLEKRVIERVLELKEGNISQAASYLRIPRHVLAYRLAKYGIRRPS